jgi:hypothetical protein
MTTTDVQPWVHIGEPGPPAGFFAGDLPGLPPEQAHALRSLELAERAEQREREERLAEHQEQSYNRCVAEAISRAHAAGKPWNPARPFEFYPTHEQRVAEAFAVMDAQAAAELRTAKRDAARVLREHGIHSQVVVDSNGGPPSPHPGGQSLSPGDTEPPASRSIGMASSGPEVAAPPLRRSGAPRLPGEDTYIRMRARRFFDRVGRKGQR